MAYFFKKNNCFIVRQKYDFNSTLLFDISFSLGCHNSHSDQLKNHLSIYYFALDRVLVFHLRGLFPLQCQTVLHRTHPDSLRSVLSDRVQTEFHHFVSTQVFPASSSFSSPCWVVLGLTAKASCSASPCSFRSRLDSFSH